MSRNGPHFVLVASTGRTGTTYLERALHSVSAETRQEPPPSRSLYMLSNLAAAYPGAAPSARRAALAIYRRSRGRWLAACRQPAYVEINPFLSNLLPDLLRTGPAPDAVLHVVRDPVDWVRSMIRFGAYAWRRPLVRVLPFVYYRDHAVAGWGRLGFARRLAHEWLYRNGRILAAEAAGCDYARVRYEDLFRHDAADLAVLTRAFEAVGLPISGEQIEAAGRVNASRDISGAEVLSCEDILYIRDITRPLAERLCRA